MSKRSKSAGRPGRNALPPVNRDEKSLTRAKQTSLKDLSRSNADFPSTSSLPIANGRQISAYMNSSSLGPRSVFSRKSTFYGRNENSEMFNDVRDQLFDAKKQISELNQKNKVLNTRLNRVTRESERRETHLQSIMAGRFQPAELNDTHLAVTLASLDKSRLENESLINAQALRIRELERNTKMDESIEAVSDDDYPEGFHFDHEGGSTNGRASRSRSASRRVPEEWLEKHKRKIELAKAHVEQNRELKAKLKEMSTQLAETKKKLPPAGAPPTGKARVSTAEVNRIMTRIQENGLLKQQVDSVTKELQQKLTTKSAELEDLRSKLNTLQDGVELEKKTVSEQMQEVKRRELTLEDERNKMQDEHNLRELQQEQLTGEISQLEDERKRLSEERDEWTRMRASYEKIQTSMEADMRKMEETINNLRDDNNALRRRMSDLLQATITDTKVQQKVLEMEDKKSRESSPSRPQNIPRLDMRDMSVDNTSPEMPSANSHASPMPASPATLWDARINYLMPAIVSHIIRQDAIFIAAEEAKNTH